MISFPNPILIQFWSKFLSRPRILVKKRFFVDLLKVSRREPNSKYSHMSMELFKRLKSGDLRQRYEDEVIHTGHPDRDVMMVIMNTMCGNMELDCAYATYAYSEYAYYNPGK